MQQLLRKWLRRIGYDLHRIEEPGSPLEILPFVVRDHLRQNPDFFVVQIGANDGKSGDPIYDLVHEHTLSGLFVEPLPDVFHQLVASYRDQPNCAFENCAIADEDGSRPLWRVARDEGVPDWATQWASFDRDTLLRNVRACKDDPHLRIEQVQVSTLTIRSLAEKHRIEEIDLLQVDTEGFDYEILRSLFKSDLRPKIINYEHFHLRTHLRNACVELLVNYGYSLCRGRMDTVAVQQRQATPPRGRAAINSRCAATPRGSTSS